MTRTWQESTIREYVTNAIQESLVLDYKAADALGSSEGKKSEITKDVSAMANSAGGLIIYGVKEFKDPAKKHLPEDIDPIDQTIITKEWLEQVINNIRPRIDGIVIHPVTLSLGANNVVYVIEIPQSSTAHQANDKRYYKRFNFLSVPMEDYEIRDVMSRAQYPKIELNFEIDIETKARRSSNDFMPYSEQKPTKYTEYTLVVIAKNTGKVFAQYVNTFVQVPSELIEQDEYNPEDPLSDNGRLYYEYSEVNTTRDVVDVEVNLIAPITKYGPARYVPILPGLSHEWRIDLTTNFEYIDNKDLEIRWEVYADNAPVNEGGTAVSSISINNNR